MAENANVQRGIEKSWSLISFCKEHGNPRYVDDYVDQKGATFAALSFSSERFEDSQIRDYVNPSTGEVRKSSYVMVSFSQNCPVTTMEDIVANVDKLQVIQLKKDAEHNYTSFKLCSKGEYEERGTLISIA